MILNQSKKIKKNKKIRNFKIIKFDDGEISFHSTISGSNPWIVAYIAYHDIIQDMSENKNST